VNLTSVLGKLFDENFNRSAEVIIRSPGRVNLIGEHTDYNGGLSLPFAIDRYVMVGISRRVDGQIRLLSNDQNGIFEISIEDLLKSPALGGWVRYPLGVFQTLIARGLPLGGCDVGVVSDLPMGAGLSSSAALLAGVGLALMESFGFELSKSELVEVIHFAESHYGGSPVGYLDQMAIVQSKANHALRIDFSDKSTLDVGLPFGEVAIFDSRVKHSISAGGYGLRRRECEEAAQRLGVASLSLASLSDAYDKLDDLHYRRTRHVLNENSRVSRVVDSLRKGLDVGIYLTASHASLRDDFEVSCKELDLIVDEALHFGASGARMVGGGFGGSVLVLGGDWEALSRSLEVKFNAMSLVEPKVLIVSTTGTLQRVA
ncbi:unnamed protein product, partial [Acidithrix sp. C25]